MIRVSAKRHTLTQAKESDLAAKISDIANRVGVTMTTVSKVLNNKPSGLRISAKTRERIFRTARELNYRPSYAARALARGKTNSLGLICGDIHTPFYAELTSHTLHLADRKGYHLIVSVTEWDFAKEVECLDMLLDGRVDGVLMVAGGLQPGTPQHQYVVETGFPIVLVDMAIEGISSVSTDWLSGMDGAVAHLKGRGHRKVWMVAYPLPLPLVDPKTIAFCESCERHRMEWHIVNGGSDLRAVRQMGRALAEEADRPTAVIAYSDYAATGLISGIRDGGLEVPRDIAVVGIDGTEAGAYYHPALTTIGAGIERLAGEAVDLLFKLVSSDRGASPRSLSLASSLTIRSSA